LVLCLYFKDKIPLVYLKPRDTPNDICTKHSDHVTNKKLEIVSPCVHSGFRYKSGPILQIQIFRCMKC
jgi:hypothetical protein